MNFKVVNGSFENIAVEFLLGFKILQRLGHFFFFHSSRKTFQEIFKRIANTGLLPVPMYFYLSFSKPLGEGVSGDVCPK